MSIDEKGLNAALEYAFYMTDGPTKAAVVNILEAYEAAKEHRVSESPSPRQNMNSEQQGSVSAGAPTVAIDHAPSDTQQPVGCFRDFEAWVKSRFFGAENTVMRNEKGRLLPKFSLAFEAWQAAMSTKRESSAEISLASLTKEDFADINAAIEISKPAAANLKRLNGLQKKLLILARLAVSEIEVQEGK